MRILLAAALLMPGSSAFASQGSQPMTKFRVITVLNCVPLTSKNIALADAEPHLNPATRHETPDATAARFPGYIVTVNETAERNIIWEPAGRAGSPLEIFSDSGWIETKGKHGYYLSKEDGDCKTFSKGKKISIELKRYGGIEAMSKADLNRFGRASAPPGYNPVLTEAVMAERRKRLKDKADLKANGKQR